jgi:MFS family permease
MIDRSWQGRALGVLQSAGSAGRLLGPLLGGWLLMLDLKKPIAEYGRTPFLVAALLCIVGAVLAFCLKRPADDRSVEPVPIGSNV